MGLYGAYFAVRGVDPFGNKLVRPNNTYVANTALNAFLIKFGQRTPSATLAELFKGEKILSHERYQCAQWILKFLGNKNMVDGFQEAIEDIGWELGDLLFYKASFWWKYGYQITRVAIGTYNEWKNGGGTDPNDCKKLIFHALKEILAVGIEAEGLDDLDDVAVNQLVDYLFTMADGLNTFPQPQFEEAKFHLDWGLSGSAQCQFIIIGNKNFKKFAIRGSCQFKCVRGQPVPLQADPNRCNDCPCGESLSFQVDTRGEFGNSFFGHDVTFDPDGATDVLKVVK
jgi:hypothetical protein